MDWVRAGITDGFGVSGENDNSRRVVQFCVERGMCVSNIYFEHRSLRNYMKVAWGQERVEVKSMIDLVLVKRDMLCCLGFEGSVMNGIWPLIDNHVILTKNL